jgi:hypothetical protein
MLPNTESPEIPAPRLPPLKDGKIVGGHLVNQKQTGAQQAEPMRSTSTQSIIPQVPAAAAAQ